MKKRSGERARRENPLAALFPELRDWVREGGQIPTLWIYIGLALLTMLVYLPAAWHDFIALADYEYVRDNAHVANGLTWGNFLWAFRTGHTGLWQPLTWLSLMRDSQLFGVSPAALHLNNVLLHTCNVLLLFFVLRWLTGDRWCSAFVAALFAVHPLNVESVAWIAERKDLLGTLFFLLTILAYGQYLERRGRGPYLLLLVMFTLGCMTSPIVLTLPFVLLLLDYWPLGYFDVGLEIRRILFEKIPLFALSAFFCVVTFFVHKRNDALSIFDSVSFSGRLANALLSYPRYLGKIFWPANLAVPYPYDQSVTVVSLWGAGILLALITAAVIYFGRQKRYLITGWLWFLGTLVPTIGLVQIGPQSMADRYAYIPAVGVFIGIAWGCADLFARQSTSRRVALIAAIVLCLAAMKTSFQLNHWKNTETLLRHSAEVDPENYLALEALGNDHLRHRRLDEAVNAYERTLRLFPNRPFTRSALGSILYSRGLGAEASQQYEQALSFVRPSLKLIGPTDRAKVAVLMNNLAWLRATMPDPKLRNSKEALQLATESIELTGRLSVVQLNTLAAAQAEAGHFDVAVTRARQAVDLARALRQKDLMLFAKTCIAFYEVGQPVRQLPGRVEGEKKAQSSSAFDLLHYPLRAEPTPSLDDLPKHLPPLQGPPP